MAPAIDPQPGRRWLLPLALWPFATGAVAINLFLLGLIGVSMGRASISPLVALLWSLPLGLPATWAATRWVRSLIRAADQPPSPRAMSQNPRR